MLCDSCIHNKVCKEIDNFKEYNKQYEQMKKKCSLFDKPIECPCYSEDINSHEQKARSLFEEHEKESDVSFLIGEIYLLITKLLVKIDEQDEMIGFLEKVSNIRIKNNKSNDGFKKKIDAKYQGIINQINELK